MNALDVFGDIAAQRLSLMSVGLEPLLVRGSESTFAELMTLLSPLPVKIGPLMRFMDLEVMIDNYLPFGTVRVLGAYK